ncbi:MAG: TlpA family protein disulfide reductase [Bacteroidales bacterium]
MRKYIFVILIILSSCKAEKKYGTLQRGEAIIEGQVEFNDSSSKAVTLIHGTRIAETERKTEILDSTGEFRFKFEILHPHNITIRYEEGNAVLFTRPGDSLYLTLNSSAFRKEKFPDFEIFGTSVQTSKNIQNFLQYREQHTEDFNSKKYSNLPVKEYLKKIRHQISNEDSVLSLFNEKHHPTEEFVTWARNDIIYRNANSLISYNYFNRDLKQEESHAMFDKTIFPVDNDNAFVSRLYALHLGHYVANKYYQADSVQNLLDNDQQEKAHRICLNEIIKNEKAGLSREIMCYKLFSLIDKEAHFDAFVALWKDRNKFIRNKILLSLLEDDLLSGAKNQKQGSDKNKTTYSISYRKYQSNEKGEITGSIINHLAEKYKRKVIYLDIWATSCGPCRSEFRHMIDLHNDYTNEPVVFVSFCLSSELSDWKEAVKTQNILGERYYFNKTQTKLLQNKLNFLGYPTYMLIDKNGNLVDKQAPRPSSDDKIKNKLDKLIEK